MPSSRPRPLSLQETCAGLAAQLSGSTRPRQCSFSAGAYTFAHSTGLQTNTGKFPLVVQQLTALIRGACPDARFSSFTLQRNVQVQMHVDKNNEPDHDSIILLCGRWQGGSLWIQNEGGAQALDTELGPGTMQRITWPCIRFSPHLRHATMPWSSGDRTILVAYVVRSSSRLSEDECHTLRYYGSRSRSRSRSMQAP